MSEFQTRSWSIIHPISQGLSQRQTRNGRVGVYSKAKPGKTKLTELLNEGYSFHPDVPNWVGDVFFWEFGTDAVPYDPKPGSIWNVINTDHSKQ